MKKNASKYALAVMLAGMMTAYSAGCGNQVHNHNDTAQTETETETAEEDASGGQAKETLMVYMVGSNLESEAGAATADLQEMALSGYDSDEMNIIVCAGGAQKWWNTSVSSDGLSVYEMKNRDLQNVSSMDSANMGEAGTLTEFMDYAYENYPADHYGLILWDHGGGAVIGYGADENYGYDMLSLTELKEGISNAELEKDTKLEAVGFDACLMGMTEVADTLSPYANYMIASEEVESGEGWDYSCLSDITDEDAYSGQQMAEKFISAYKTYYDNYGTYAPDYTLSCVDLSQMPDVMNNLESLVTAADRTLTNGGYNIIAKSRDSAKDFGMISSDSFYDYVDLYTLTDDLGKNFPNEAKALKASLEKAVILNGSNVSRAYGLSIYFPYSNKDYANEWVEAYRQTGFCPNYVSFITDFTATLQGDAAYQWDIAETVPEQGSETSEYYIQLTEEEIQNFGHANASIWQPDDEDTYICWLTSKNIALSDDGRLSTDFDGRIFYLIDNQGYDHPCCAVEIERTDDYVKYAIPVVINILSPDITNAYIHVKVDDAHPEGEICGVYSTLDTDSELYPDKNIIKIEDGDDITPFLFARDIVFGDNQTVAPFEQWKPSSGAGETFTVSGDFTAQLKENENKDNYICLFNITDTQGNEHFTNYLEMNADSF